MDHLREICIIHNKECRIASIYMREFVKWIGFSFFDYTYNEFDDSLNAVFQNEKGKFDIIFYINDPGVFKERFQQYGEFNIDVNQNDNDNSDNDVPEINKSFLMSIWNEIFLKLGLDGNLDFKKAITKLIDIYFDFELTWLLYDNRYYINKKLEFNMESDFRENCRMQYLNQSEQWDRVIDELDEFIKNGFVAEEYSGKEYFQYAYVNSCRRQNELDKSLERRGSFDTLELLIEADKIYVFDKFFSSVEHLKTKIASLDMQYDSMSYEFNQASIEGCPVALCNSFNQYRYGKKFELRGLRERAYSEYRMAYRKNQANYRALYKVAVEQILLDNWDDAKYYLKSLLSIFQLDILFQESFRNIVIYLPPIELEYACKCYVLLGNIEIDGYGNYINAEKYYNSAVRIYELIDSNYFIQGMCTDNVRGGLQSDFKKDFLLQQVKMDLSPRVMQAKIQKCRGTKMFTDWEKEYGR